MANHCSIGQAFSACVVPNSVKAGLEDMMVLAWASPDLNIKLFKSAARWWGVAVSFCVVSGMEEPMVT